MLTEAGLDVALRIGFSGVISTGSLMWRVARLTLAVNAFQPSVADKPLRAHPGPRCP